MSDKESLTDRVSRLAKQAMERDKAEREKPGQMELDAEGDEE